MQEVTKKVVHGEKKNHKIAIKSCQIILEILNYSEILYCLFVCFDFNTVVLVSMLVYDDPFYIYKDKVKSPKVRTIQKV